MAVYWRIILLFLGGLQQPVTDRGEGRGGEERASVARRFPGFCTCPDGTVV